MGTLLQFRPRAHGDHNGLTDRAREEIIALFDEAIRLGEIERGARERKTQQQQRRTPRKEA